MTERLAKLQIEETGIALITLSRPAKRNALSRQFLQELNDAIDTVQNEPRVRLLILDAEGPVFCAGMDLGEMQERANQPEASAEWREDARLYRVLLEKLFHLPVPTLAVVQGAAIAGGFGLVLACDIVLAEEEAVFSLPEPKRGITAAVVTPFLTFRTGPGVAGYLLLSGRSISAKEGRQWGLCHEIVPKNSLTEQTENLAASILTGSKSALAVTKANLLECAGATLSGWLEKGMTASAQARESEDAREGLAAFLEKRNPRWFLDES